MPDPVLRIRGLRKAFGKRVVVDDLNLEVQPGEIFGFLGPNGAGKTTTIKMITGLLRIGGGQIEVCGDTIAGQYERYMAHIGAIVEEPQLYRYLSGLDNLRYYAAMYPGVDQKRIDEVVEITGLQHRIHDKVKAYSLGMRQRLGLAQALLHRPALLVLDEPTNGLDPAGMKEIRDFLRYICHEFGTSVFVSSHLLAEMQQMCDRVGVLQNGRLLGVRSVAEMTGLSGAGAELILEVDRPQEAAVMLSSRFGLACAVREDGVHVPAEKAMAPQIAGALAAEGFALYSLRHGAAKSLEDIFISMTGGGSSIV